MKVGFLEDRGVGADKKARLLCGFDTVDRLAENPIALDAEVVRLLKSVQVNVEEEPRGRFEFMKSLSNKHPVRAQINVLFPIENFAYETAKLGIDERLAATDRNNRSAALV